MVNIGIVGTGFVGLAHAAATARTGHDVVAYDIDERKIEAFSTGKKSEIKKYIHEKNLAELINEQLSKKHLRFSSNKKDLSEVEAFFMCLPTPYLPNGSSDLSTLYSALDDLSDIFTQNGEFKLIINKSTVPIGTAKAVYDVLTKKGLTNFDVVSNPEFLPEGNAVEHAIHAKKVVVGANQEDSFKLLRKIYASFTNNPNTTYLETNPETAEAVKYASNALLYSQIVSWQAIPGRIAESNSAVNFDQLRKGILADPRIAKWGSYPSAGAGGSCFKKDALSIAYQLEQNGAESQFVKLLDSINERQKTYLIKRAETEAKYSFNNKVLSVLGTSFKQDTNDIRESNVLAMIPEFLARGATEIRIYDPLALEETKAHFHVDKNKLYGNLLYFDSIEEALNGSDCTLIATDHQEFKTIASSFKHVATPHLILDGRKMVSNEDVQELLEKGVSYLPVAGTYLHHKL